MVSKVPAAETVDDEEAATLQSENQKVKKQIQEQYGWYFLAKEVADYVNCTFFEILERSAMEILSIVMIIQAKIEINKLSSNATKP